LVIVKAFTGLPSAGLPKSLTCTSAIALVARTTPHTAAVSCLDAAITLHRDD